MENTSEKKVMLSGIQPSGTLTIGNYLGALKRWSDYSDCYDCYYFIADLHALTVRQVPADLRRRTLETLAIYHAAGLDPKKNVIFVQSHVHEHAELAWILDCNTMFGELSRMTQFKDKSAKNAQNINAGLFTYPVLMAADILLYRADFVPVGQDQKQHVEIARDIAERFNGIYGETFKIPEPQISKTAAKIYSLSDPTKKMSKSDDEQSYVSLLDERDVIIRKFRRAVTDSDTVVRYAEGKDGINNLMTIYSCFTGKSNDEIEKEFAGKGYGDFKAAVGEVCADALTPVREEFKQLMGDRAYLEGIMRENAEKAHYTARKTLSKVYRKVGLLSLDR